MSTGSLVPPAADTPRSIPDYVATHWRGDLSLGVSYWGNVVLPSVVMPIVMSALVDAIEQSDAGLQMAAGMSLALLVLALAVYVWGVVGAYRSSGKHVARGGSVGWATTAKVMLVLSMLGNIGQIARVHLPLGMEYGRLVLGQDSLEKAQIQIGPDGQTLVLTGTLGMGSANEFRRVLAGAPQARVVDLHSPGGRLLEGQRMAAMIKERGLDTYVQGECSSACTFLFLAGKARYATASAQLGFHRPSIAGMDERAELLTMEQMLSVYREAGLKEGFVQRVAQTRHQDMWYPTHQELLDHSVINSRSLGEGMRGRIALMSQDELKSELASEETLRAIDERFPGTLDDAVRRGMAARERGAADQEVMAAMRDVVPNAWTAILKTSSDAGLARFVAMLLAQYKTAAVLGHEACASFLDGTLAPSQVLPAALRAQETALLRDLLREDRHLGAGAYDRRQVETAMRTIASRMAPELFAVIVEEHPPVPHSPAARCNGTIRFFEEVDALPAIYKIPLLRYMYQRV